MTYGRKKGAVEINATNVPVGTLTLMATLNYTLAGVVSGTGREGGRRSRCAVVIGPRQALLAHVRQKLGGLPVRLPEQRRRRRWRRRRQDRAARRPGLPVEQHAQLARIRALGHEGFADAVRRGRFGPAGRRFVRLRLENPRRVLPRRGGETNPVRDRSTPYGYTPFETRNAVGGRLVRGAVALQASHSATDESCRSSVDV